MSARMQSIGAAQPSAIARTLCPLDPDKYLRWLWVTCGGRGRAMNAREWWLAFHRPEGIAESESRTILVQLAASIRRRQRLQRMADRNTIVPTGECAKEHGTVASLRAEPDSFWPQLAGGGHDLALPSVAEWTIELNSEGTT